MLPNVAATGRFLGHIGRFGGSFGSMLGDRILIGYLF
jgi:hypothetical protein